ncbi:MAG: hypothetical protein NC341_08140 [Blautia sp.]|nr:hypothetical protein [Blautia sp.]MCM1201360.1 hypothetical protein [Bacteroides fragilis]
MKKRHLYRIVSAWMLPVLVVTLMSGNVAFAEENDKEVIVIRTAEELLAVAEKCDTDVWSADKQIELQEDISLAGIDFEPIAVFAGTFNGNGHAVTDFHYVGSGYADGFFRYITPAGIVQNLTISGWVEAGNEEKCTGGICGINGGWILECTFSGRVEGKSETGGIAGENESTGTISSCSVIGSVTGYDRAGGIAGGNYGTIRNCTNRAGINSDSSWLEEADESSGLEWLLEDISEGKLVSGTDIGGIAGYSKGLLINCDNEGVVGYEHNGYNIGGIVGRQSGQVIFCSNNGYVYGRKDVGGIVGQMEPYISVEEAESLSEAVQRLHDLVDIFLEDAGKTQDSMSGDFDILRSYSDEALKNADSIADRTTDFIDENISAVNEAADRMRYCMEQVPFIMDDVSDAIDSMNETADALGRVVDALDLDGKAEDTVYDETAHARLSLVSGVGGEVYTDSVLPAEGETVTLSAAPEEGYRLRYISAADASKETLDLTMLSDTEYAFVMPAGNVVVKAEFTCDGNAVSGTGDGSVSAEVLPAGSGNGGNSGTDGITQVPGNVPEEAGGGAAGSTGGASAGGALAGEEGTETDNGPADEEEAEPGEKAPESEEKTPESGENTPESAETAQGAGEKPSKSGKEESEPAGEASEQDAVSQDGGTDPLNEKEAGTADTVHDMASSNDETAHAERQFRKLVNASGGPDDGVYAAERTITILKNGSDESTKSAYAGDVVVVNIQPDSGCRASVRITADGKEIAATEKMEGRACQFTMPDADVTVEVGFVKAGVIVESNAGGKAEYSISGNQLKLQVRPNAGYVEKEHPTAADGAGNQLMVSGKSAGAYAYEIDLGNAVSPVRVNIVFAAGTDSAAVSTSKDNLNGNVSLLKTQMRSVSDTMSKIDRLVNGKTLDEIRNDGNSEELIGYILDLAQDLSDAGSTLSYILSDLASISNVMTPYMEEALKQADVELDFVIDDLEDVFSGLDAAFGRVRSTVVYVTGKFDIQFTKPGHEMEESVDSLFDQLSAITAYAGQINDDLNVHSDILEADMHAVNDQINYIVQLFVERIDNVEDLYFDGDGYEDISEEDIDAGTAGKVERAVNNGVVKGDINVGGVAGSMAIDEEDPEGNAAGSVNRSFGSRYLTRCILTGCENNGQITAKKNGAGGIVGYMNLGIAADCEAYGSVESTEGEYIGGISGESLALIRNCWSLVSLKGSRYVGGIAGSGTKIQNCHAMVLIDDEAVQKGAIAGWLETKEDERIGFGEDIKDNFFVGGTLRGIDDVSYAGVAEPVTYEELLAVEGVPLQYRHLRLTFTANDKVVDQIEVKYGRPLSEIEFPQTPPVPGSYGKWPDVTEMKMIGNITLEAEYSDTITTLTSLEKSAVVENDADNQNRPYAYVEGIYTDDAVLSVSATEHTAQQTKEETNQKAESVVYGIHVENGGLSGDTVSSVRLLNPYGKIRAVLSLSEGVWQEIDYKEYGRYIQVAMTGETAAYCIVSGSKAVSSIWYAAAGAAILLAIGIMAGLKRGKRKGKKTETEE